MARYTEPKNRLSRREGFDIFGKGEKLRRANVPPGVHGPKGVKSLSQYGKQLREKQKVKRIYGMLEKQFRSSVEQSMRTRGNTADRLLALLETRLDNVVFRLGFSPTRTLARQAVSHRHVLVNGKKVNIPSYKVKKGDSIGLTAKGMAIPAIAKILEEKNVTIPGWLNRKGAVGMVEREPLASDVVEPISAQDIIEFYSR